MKRVGMFFRGVVCGVAVLSLLFTFSVPAADAQFLDLATAELKIKGNLKTNDPVDGIGTEKGNFEYPVHLRETGAMGIPFVPGFAFEYGVSAFVDAAVAGDGCVVLTVGTIWTQGSDEETALGFYSLPIYALPDPGDFADTFIRGEFNMKIKYNNSDEWKNAKSKGGFGVLEHLVGEILATTKNFKFNLKPMDFDKLVDKYELNCVNPFAP